MNKIKFKIMSTCFVMWHEAFLKRKRLSTCTATHRLTKQLKFLVSHTDRLSTWKPKVETTSLRSQLSPFTQSKGILSGCWLISDPLYIGCHCCAHWGFYNYTQQWKVWPNCRFNRSSLWVLVTRSKYGLCVSEQVNGVRGCVVLTWPLSC